MRPAKAGRFFYKIKLIYVELNKNMLLVIDNVNKMY